jgi:hypothetical protein
MFPTKYRLWQGAVRVTIAHAVWTAANPDFAYAVSWDGANYNLNNAQGTRGTVTFADDVVVGAFFDSHSSRSPFISKKRSNPLTYFRGAPPSVVTLAETQTLR